MGKLLDKDQTQVTPSNFHFSGARIEDLGAAEYTLAAIAVDVSSSVSPFKSDLQKALGFIVDSLGKSPRKDNLLVRISEFNDRVSELHGFLGLDKIDPQGYSLNVGGCTALYDGIMSSVEAVQQYGESLSDMDFFVNGVVFVVTDGEENASRVANESKIKALLGRIVSAEKLESIKVILISVGNRDTAFFQKIATDCGIDQYVPIAGTSASDLAKLADFISRSISSSSQSLGTGGPSQNLTF